MSFLIRDNKEIVNDFSNLDNFQREIVLSQDKNILIKAPAGSGKTTTLISAIINYRYFFLNDTICAITYTRAAKAEMEMRLREKGVMDVNVTTIHVWARERLEEFSKRYGFRINVLTESDIMAILEDITHKYLVSRGRNHKIKVNTAILYNFIMGNKNMDITLNYKSTLMAIERRYIEYKRSHMLYDFTDYPLYLYDIMKIYDERITNIDALFVDEFQDVDPVQFELFKMVDSKKKFYIGDPWQSIFLFRGADGVVFKKLDNFNKRKLGCNYRSYQEIIDYASTVYSSIERDADGSHFITDIQNADHCAVDCAKGYGGEVIVYNNYDDSYIYKNNKQYFMGSNEFNQEFNNILDNNPIFLCRTNKAVKTLSTYGITNASTIHQAKGLEYNDVIVVSFEINSIEDLNIAYVALTRAKNRLVVMDMSSIETLLRKRKYE